MMRNLPVFSGRPQQPAGCAPGLRQRGISVIAAIFLLLLMAGLAAFMVSMISATNLNLAADVGGSRAYQAARAGVELGLYKVMQEAPANGNPATKDDALADCFSAVTPTIETMTVAVKCEQFPPGGDYREGARTIRIYRITATANAPGPGGGIERQVEVTVEKCRDSTNAISPFDC